MIAMDLVDAMVLFSDFDACFQGREYSGVCNDES